MTRLGRIRPRGTRFDHEQAFRFLDKGSSHREPRAGRRPSPRVRGGARGTDDQLVQLAIENGVRCPGRARSDHRGRVWRREPHGGTARGVPMTRLVNRQRVADLSFDQELRAHMRPANPRRFAYCGGARVRPRPFLLRFGRGEAAVVARQQRAPHRLDPGLDAAVGRRALRERGPRRSFDSASVKDCHLN